MANIIIPKQEHRDHDTRAAGSCGNYSSPDKGSLQGGEKINGYKDQYCRKNAWNAY